MKKVMKEELAKHSYLTMSKNISTADQLIKTIELNGNCVNTSGYTLNPEREYRRKERMTKILQNLFKELNFRNYFDITPETVNEWIEKLQKLSPEEMSVHKVFRPSDFNKEVAEMQLARKSSIYKSAVDKMLQRRNSDSKHCRVLKPASKKVKARVKPKTETICE